MKFSRKTATGAVALASAATVALAAAPANAFTSGAAGPAADKIAVKSCGGGWNKAGGVPLKWSKSTTDGCGIFGRPGHKVVYKWAAFKGSACVKAKGFTKAGKKKWYNAGCGKSGSVKVYWGNVLAEKQIMIKGASLISWR
ncbi:hypothetical protein [Streptomyces sclerotialus]|uniref:hypothetical protein n=1 Tax=Streptomyces sclerotialus TaxID=1957 RepID=UPI0004CA9561